MTTTLLLIAVGMFCLERLKPARALPEVRAWWPRVLLVNALQLGIVLLAAVSWDRWLSRASLLDVSGWPVALQGLVAYLVATLVYYAWHRARHASPLLWRLFHQLHHAPSRLEVATSFYKHPLEVVANSLISAAIAFLLFGCSPLGGAVYTLLAGTAEFFYHWNLRTPRWLGYVIQRPEAHRIHHERGRHAGNYADLPIIDMLFGTFVDPAGREVECGFEPAREDRFADMLRCRDVHADVQADAPQLTVHPGGGRRDRSEAA